MTSDTMIGWWNNHSGGFIKMALIQGIPGNVGAGGKKALLSNQNSKTRSIRFCMTTFDALGRLSNSRPMLYSQVQQEWI